MSNEYIPPATLEKLAADFPKGTRHKAKLDIAIPLIGNGYSPVEVAAILHQKFTEASEAEISGVVNWATNQRPAPSLPQPMPFYPRVYTPRVMPPPKRTPLEQVEWWTSGSRQSPCEMAAASPVSLPPVRTEALALLFSTLYDIADHVNIVCRYTLDQEKCRPTGAGRTLIRDEWLRYFSETGIPQSDAGAWLRLNPCAAIGTGTGCAITDADITAFRFVLCESDTLPLPMQLALFRRLRLPIAAIVLSGGNSAHAWVRVAAPNAEAYKTIAKRLLDALKGFGIDQANCNPSRLCRLPEATRTIGAVDGGAQRLLWLNPSVLPLTEALLARFEESLELPHIEEQPLLTMARAAIDRYDHMRANRGNLGVTTGIPELDLVCGGWKRGQTIVIAGATGGCKTTLGLHMIMAALKRGKGVSLFSLEMDREEVFDLLVSTHCRVNRNHFNNGMFTDYDLEAMTQRMPELSRLPLYIDDSALSSVHQIKARVMQLKADRKIDLVVVDYIQFVNPLDTRDNREQQVATISHDLRALARESQLPFIILSQLNDEGKLRESRVIAHNANVVIVVNVDGNVVKTNIVKGRGIPNGCFSLEFDRTYATLIPKSVPASSSGEAEITVDSADAQCRLPYAHE